MERHGLASYLIGFVLAVILTAIPFWLVYSHTLPPNWNKRAVTGGVQRYNCGSDANLNQMHIAARWEG